LASRRGLFVFGSALLLGVWAAVQLWSEPAPGLPDDSAGGPARIHAAPLLLRPGVDPSRLGFAPPETILQAPWRLSVARFPEALYAGAEPRPSLVELRDDASGRVASLHASDGRELAEVLVPAPRFGSLYGRGAVDREPVALHALPPQLVDAVLLVEDRRFFEHSGIDPRRIAGAALANLRAGRIREGGSTVTQQLVKNLYLTRERTFSRKLREATLALRLEGAAPKPAILEAYLNEIYLGQRGSVAVHGVAAAARHWFAKDVSQLSLAESCLLAGMIRGPSFYSPVRHPARALTRRNGVLRRLLEGGHISEAEYLTAVQEPLQVAPRLPRTGAWFLDRVEQELLTRYSRRQLASRGLRVVTTLDLRLQRAAEAAVSSGLRALEEEHPTLRRSDAPLQAALVALDPRRGDVLALVGGRDYGRSQFNRALYARRQPGSVFKPIVALAAFTSEEPVASLETLLLDAPLRVVRPEGVWRPLNYDRRFRGPVTLQEALERSLNVPLVRLGGLVGAPRIAATGRRLGIESALEPVPALALGASEVTLFEMTRAYAVLAAEGELATPRLLNLVLDPRGGAVWADPSQRRRVAAPDAVRQVTRALRGAVERGTARRIRALGFHGPVAGKTGSTSGFRDAWFVGYTPELVMGVWVGFDDGRSVGLPGSRAALPIFTAVLKEALGPDGGEAFHFSTELEPRPAPPDGAGDRPLRLSR